MTRLLPICALALAPTAWAGELLDASLEDAFGGIRPETTAPIINGESAALDDYPMTGGLIMDAGAFGMNTRATMCSSTLIAPDVVLLAGHCADFLEALGLDPSILDYLDFYWSRQVDLSAYQMFGEVVDLPADAVKASLIVAPDEWDIQALQIGLSENYDIALMFLEEAVLDVPHAYLPTAEEAEQIVEGMEVAVVGWGQQSQVDQGQQPPPGSVGIKMQGMSFISELADYEFKVGEIESDVRKCHGDSGGPSFAWFDAETVETMRLIGVTSHAYDTTDCRETGGVDTRVDYYLDWIDASMRAACEDGTRVWCDEPGIVYAPFPEPEEEEEEEIIEDEEVAGGCACSAAPGMSFSLLGLLPILALRRRK